jgi:hypothetical protein
MPSVSPKQGNLMAACAKGALYKRCPPLKVARDFNRADKGKGILKRAAGGTTPLETGLDSHLNFGMGHGRNFFSTTPLMGHAMSGTPLGGKQRFAEGGEVKKPAGPSAKERREIRSMIEQGKDDAVAALRATRSALSSASPEVSLEKLRTRLAMKNGGGVSTEAPDALYAEYMQLMEGLEDPQLDPNAQAQLIDRIADLSDKLESMGIAVGPSPE